MEIIVNLSKIQLILLVMVLIMALFVILWIKDIIKIVKIFKVYFLSYYFGRGAQWCGGPNTWAVITGATDGIGLAYAEAMAQKGYNLVLMSRSSGRLDKLKGKFEETHKNRIEVKTIAVDFSKSDIYNYIEEELKKVGEIHVLINNVGICNKYPEYFTSEEYSGQFLTDIININVLSMTRLMKIILPQMVTKKRGIIINVSSYSALIPTPLLSVYSATKIYEDHLSRALNAEYAHKGIIIQSVLPYYVSTKMIMNPKPSFMIPSADDFVKSALKTVGVETRTHGYFRHTILAFLHNLVIGENLKIKLAFFKLRRMRNQTCAQSKKFKKLLNNV